MADTAQAPRPPHNATTTNGYRGIPVAVYIRSATIQPTKVKGGLFLHAVTRKLTASLQLISSGDQPLLVRRDSFLVLDSGRYITNGVRRPDLQCGRLSGQSLHKDLHPTTKTQNGVKRWFLRDVTAGESTAVFKLFPCKHETLLTGRNTFLILDLRLHVANRIRRFDLRCGSPAREGPDEYLHTTVKT
ncbi:hypothetical protein F5050DRAFT_1811349 [Lentinula boryana]|uniref:Uncharacterized protein n=1 Tax=Lentinula boryana TaxID=40481 RepID=A0ABQ8Q257_9AGAR|nr:hypothetical protein F5050DRAFT_1811349 [Lentinula boryana]